MKIANTLLKIAESVPKVGAGKVAAALVYKNRIVSFGCNSLKTHPMQAKFGRYPYLHAETECMIRASKDLTEYQMSKSSLYVVRAKLDSGRWIMGMSKPCSGCTHCIGHFRIENVFYSTDDGFMEKLMV
jgi:tRNA(Arg) A34 adenosine deaminase TadA